MGTTRHKYLRTYMIVCSHYIYVHYLTGESKTRNCLNNHKKFNSYAPHYKESKKRMPKRVMLHGLREGRPSQCGALFL